MTDFRLGTTVILNSPYGHLARGFALVPNGSRGQIVDLSAGGAFMISFVPEAPNHDRIELEVPAHWLTIESSPKASR